MNANADSNTTLASCRLLVSKYRGWLNAFAPENAKFICVTPDVSVMRSGEFHDFKLEKANVIELRAELVSIVIGELNTSLLMNVSMVATDGA